MYAITQQNPVAHLSSKSLKYFNGNTL